MWHKTAADTQLISLSHTSCFWPCNELHHQWEQNCSPWPLSNKRLRTVTQFQQKDQGLGVLTAVHPRRNKTEKLQTASLNTSLILACMCLGKRSAHVHMHMYKHSDKGKHFNPDLPFMRSWLYLWTSELWFNIHANFPTKDYAQHMFIRPNIKAQKWQLRRKWSWQKPSLVLMLRIYQWIQLIDVKWFVTFSKPFVTFLYFQAHTRSWCGLTQSAFNQVKALSGPTRRLHMIRAPVRHYGD